MTATIRPRGTTRLLVRANAQFKPMPNATAKAIDDPKPYQDSAIRPEPIFSLRCYPFGAVFAH